MNPSSEVTPLPRGTVADTRGVFSVVSVVVPAFNEAENIPLLYRLVSEVLQSCLPQQWELIFVDDGSRDATWSAISELAAETPMSGASVCLGISATSTRFWPGWRWRTGKRSS